MSICILNKIDQKKFDILSSVVGEKEAERDFFEQDGVVRPPSVVLAKIEERLLEQEPETINNFSDQLINEALSKDNVISKVREVIASQNRASSLKAVEAFSKRLGIEYQIVSSEESKIKRNSDVDAKGFYQAGFVYLTAGMFTPETLFHEFSHPVIKALAKSNRKLFDKLYGDLLKEDFGKAIVENLKNDPYYKKATDDHFREEAIVQALTYMDNKNLTQSKGWFDKLMFAIRQYLRNIFGKKIGVSKLKSDTTLKDMVDMLNQDEFNLDMKLLKEDDAIMLQKEYVKTLNIVDEKSKEKAQAIFEDMNVILEQQVTNMQPGTVFYEFASGFVNEDNTGVLQTMKKAMEKLASITNKRKGIPQLKNITDEYLESLGKMDTASYIAERIKMFVGVVTEVDTVMDMFTTKIDSLPKDNLSQEEQDTLFGIAKYVDQWYSYLEQLVTDDTSSILPGGANSLRSFLRDLKQKTFKIKKDVDTKRTNGVIDTMYAHMGKSLEKSNKMYIEELSRLKDADNISGYNQLHQEYYGLTPEQLNQKDELERKKAANNITAIEEDMLSDLKSFELTKFNPTKEEFAIIVQQGKVDAGAWNSKYEGYNNNQDKVIGTFFSMLEERLNTINANSNANESDFLNGLQEHLVATGWNLKRQIGEGNFGRSLSQVTNVGKIDAQGNIVKWEVRQFMSGHHSPSFDILLIDKEVKESLKEYQRNPNTENHITWIKARNKKAEFKYNYMHQAVSSEVYESQKLFRDDIGIKARMALDRFYEDVDEMSGVALEAHINPEMAEALQQKWRDYEYLFSETNNLGILKTGEQAEIAERLREYRDSNRDFYETETNHEKFQAAYDNMINSLNNEGRLDSRTEAYKNAIDTWLEHNTTVEIDGSWYDQRSSLMEERSNLLLPLTEKNAKIEDLAPLFEEIYKLSKPAKTSNGHFNGNAVTKEVRIKIRNLHERIEEARENLYTSLGLTKAEIDDYHAITYYYEGNDFNFKSPSDKIAYNEYQKRISKGYGNYGISPSNIKRIKDIEKAIRAMSISESTGYYRDTFQELIDTNIESEKVFNEALKNVGLDREVGEPITSDQIDEILQKSWLVDDLKKSNPMFAEWFNNNHYQAERTIKSKDGGKGEASIVHLRTSLWSFTTPSDKNYFKAHPLNDIDGNMVGLVEIDGVYRVPNSHYQTRKIRDEFITEKIERNKVDGNGNLVLANIDNKGRWKPKTVEQGAKSDTPYINHDFINMFKENRAQWNLIEYVKNQHLDNQINLRNPQKLDIDYPRVRVGGIENLSRGIIRRSGQSLANAIRVQDDDIEQDASARTVDEKGLPYQKLSRPVTGMYNLEENEVSTDIIQTLGRYQYSVETFKAFDDFNSTARTLEQMVNYQTADPVAMEMMSNASIVQMTADKKDVSTRAYAIKNIIDMNFKGRALQDTGSTNDGWRKFQITALNRIMGLSAKKWFMFNFMSDVTNWGSGQLQFIYKTLDGRHFNAKNLVVGKYKSTKAINQITRTQYSADAKPLMVQFLDIMDASPDRFSKTVGEKGSRTITQDIASGRIGFGVRQYLQNAVNFTAMFALLDNKKYRFKMEGSDTFTTLDNEIELVDGKVQTKKGVPKEYAITYDSNGRAVLGNMINKVIKHHHGYLKKTTGIAGKSAESEFVNRTLLGKMLFTIMRFLPGMTMDRYQVTRNKTTQGKRLVQKGIFKRRFDWYTETSEYGIFIEALLASKNLVVGLGQVATGNLTKSELNSIWQNRNRRTGVMQLMFALAVNQLISLLRSTMKFNTDDDDPENDYAWDNIYNGEKVLGEDMKNVMLSKLRRDVTLPNISAINDVWTEASPWKQFSYSNYWKAQVLRLSYRIERENRTFDPDEIPAIALNLIIGKSAFQEGALKDIVDIAILLDKMADGDDMDIKKDAGPYKYQKKGEHKLPHAILSKALGYNGNLVSPVDGLESELFYK